MRAINHALTGAVIGLTVGEPLIAVPAAIISHFVCDLIPHFDGPPPKTKWVKSKLFKRLLYIDAALCLMLVAVLAATQPIHWVLAAICAFAAVAPDFIYADDFNKTVTGKNKQWQPTGMAKLTQDIQWFQRPIGWPVEVAWFIAGIVLITPFMV